MEPGPALSITPKRLVKRAEKHLKQFAARFAGISSQDDSDTIHDARVSSRRLQQVFAIMFPKPRTDKQRELIRILRKVRRRLGACRSVDVNLDLIAEAINGAHDAAARNAWEQLRSHLKKQRKREIKRATRKLSRYRSSEFVALSHECLDRIGADLASRDIYATLKESLEKARQRWHETLVLAKQDRDPARLHELRITAKRLRYRAELLAEFGDSGAEAWVKELKEFQQNLGRWHDRHVLFQSVAEFIGRPDFLLHCPDIARSLLDELQKARDEEAAVVQSIIKSADRVSGMLGSTVSSINPEAGIRQVELLPDRRFARQRS